MSLPSMRHLLSMAAEDVTASALNCTPPAFNEFPPDMFSQWARAHGAVLFHICVAIYIFLALAVVCDDYFVASLGKICEILGFSEDVAGATFMAAGSSAPELFTSIIGVFVAKGDVGTGTIVGSAVFNVLCIVAVCALFAGQIIYLSWWPFVRDTGFYAIAITTLILVIYDGVVTWYESLIMLALYGVYIVIMKFNRRLQQWAADHTEHISSLPRTGGGLLAADHNRIRTDYTVAVHLAQLPDQPKAYPEIHAFANPNFGQPGFYQNDAAAPVVSVSRQEERVGILMNALCCIRTAQRHGSIWEWVLLFFLSRRFHARTRIFAAGKLVIIERRRLIRQGKLSPFAPDTYAADFTGEESWRTKGRFARRLTIEDPDLPHFDAWKKPPSFNEVDMKRFFKWWIMAPIKYSYYFTIPDCRKSTWERYFMGTFVLSIVWIALLSYVMVWMVSVVGYTLGIPDSIMGITFLAAGTSIPDCMASLFVARQGQGDMALSNCVGSNVFDILLGLALPWCLQTMVVAPGSFVPINSNGLVFSVLLLFITVTFLVAIIHLSGWQLDKRLGFACLAMYIVFVIISCMIESNVFGYVNPPNC